MFQRMIFRSGPVLVGASVGGHVGEAKCEWSGTIERRGSSSRRELLLYLPALLGVFVFGWASLAVTGPSAVWAQRQSPEDRFGRQLESRQEPRWENGFGRQGDHLKKERKFRVQDGQWEEFRYFDGSNNNRDFPNLGKARIAFRRLVPSSYDDQVSLPARYDGPNARMLSNLFCDQPGDRPSGRSLSDMAWQWGQFLDHDITLTETAIPSEAYPILIPSGDAWFDPEATGQSRLFFFRSEYFAGTGIDMPRQQINSNTAWIDGSQIYGSDEETANYLRSFQRGQMKTSPGDLLPIGVDGFFEAGDIRANEQVGLTAMHILFVREHNRIADRLASFHPDWSDEEVFQATRKEVIGILQAITYNEFLPAVLGVDAIPPYPGYRPWIDPSIGNEFATAAFRFGHSMLNPQLLRLDSQYQELPGGGLPLRDAFFNPNWILSEGIDPYLRGLTRQRAQQIDPYIVDDVRNFLFGQPGAGGLDLAAFNIQRGRDHGLPGYMEIRQRMGLPVIEEFQQLPMPRDICDKMELVYRDVDQIDPWLGMLAETPEPGSSVGPTIRKVMINQFTKLRDGDRFWYQRMMRDSQLQRVHTTRLSQVIYRNSGVDRIQPNVFWLP